MNGFYWSCRCYNEQHAFLEELERAVALLAFDDASTCPVKEVKELLDNAQRQKTASELNAAILTSQSHEKGTICH